MIPVAVAADKFATGMYAPSDRVDLAYAVTSLHDALSTDYKTDAHLVAYVIDGAKRQPRINKPCMPLLSEEERAQIRCHCFFCDADNDDHAEWTDELRAEARRREAETPALQTAGVYETRGGIRIVQPLSKPILAAVVEPHLLAWLNTLESQGVAVDYKCKDWTRHYRCPNVVRDGKPYRSPYIDLSRMRPIDPPAPVAVTTSAPLVPTPAFAAPLTDRQQWARGYLSATPPAVEGSGGDHHTFVVCAAVARGFDLSDDDAFAVLSEWNARCSPPWGERELRKKIASARRSGTEPIGGRLERRVSTPPPVPAGFIDVDLRTLAREPGDDSAAIEEELRRERAEKRAAVEASFLPKVATPQKPRFAFQPGPELVAEEIVSPLWLVRGLLPESGVCVIGGEPKATKTWALLEMGMALATGTPAFGEYECQASKSVAVFLAEDGKRSLKARIAALADSRHMEQSAAVARMYFVCRGRLNLLSKDEREALVAACRSIPNLGLLCLDPLRDLHAADENDSTSMAKVTDALRWLRDEVGCSVCFVHHAHKASKESEGRRPGQRMRGSSVIHGAIDAGIYLSDTDTDLQSYWTNKVAVEIKEGAGAGVFSLTLNLDNDADGRATGGSWHVEKVEARPRQKLDSIREAVVAALQAESKPIGIRKLRERLKTADGPVRAALEALRADGLAVDLVENNIPKGWVLASKNAAHGVPIQPIHDPSTTHPRGSPGAYPSNPSTPPILGGGGVVDGCPPAVDTSDSQKPVDGSGGIGRLSAEEVERLRAAALESSEPDPELLANRRAREARDAADELRRRVLAESAPYDNPDDG